MTGDFAVPIDDDATLSRAHTAAALTKIGFPVSRATLATKATRGGGPPYRIYGQRAFYRWGDALRWAESRLGPLKGEVFVIPDHLEAVVKPMKGGADDW